MLSTPPYATRLLAAAALLVAPTRAAQDEPLEDLARLQERIDRVIELAGPATVGVQVGRTSGSGVVVSADGLVLTAAHVSGAPGRQARIRFPDGTTRTARTLGANPWRDSGMVRILDATDLAHVPIVPARALAPGEWCLALGHPGGFDQDRPAVPRLGRLQDARGFFLHTDTPLIGGDSGGPLFDLDGNLIGIHSRIEADVATNYHVPLSTFRLGWKRHLAGEEWTGSRALLGVRGLFDDLSPGARIGTVLSGSAAEGAGLESRDVIRRLNGEIVHAAEHLRWFLADMEPGDEIELAILRDGAPASLRVTLGKDEGER